jgi:CRISPR/Cas system CMR-associated protein Cmr1 (group 7 of RAMP superfamily)
MKKVILMMLFVVISLTSFSQIDSKNIDKNKLKESKFIDKLDRENIAVYEIYPTTITWCLIKLNTRNGKMWVVQYSMREENYRYETPLNNIALITEDKEVNGRFKLQSTDNEYTFILLDRIDGKTWQVQITNDPSYRFVIPIE